MCMAVRGKKKNNSAPRIRPTKPRTVRVVLAKTNKNVKLSLLTSVLEQSDFWEHLEQTRRRAKVSSSDFRILIKPDLELFNPGDATGTDPELVEQLIDLLHDRGYTQVTVGDARGVWDLWLENRDVCMLADLVGYHYVTPKGRAYDIVELSDVVPVGFAAGSVLHGSLGRAWVQAGYRINFAKNK